MEIYVDDETKLTLHGLQQVNKCQSSFYIEYLYLIHVLPVFHQTRRSREKSQVEWSAWRSRIQSGIILWISCYCIGHFLACSGCDLCLRSTACESAQRTPHRVQFPIYLHPLWSQSSRTVKILFCLGSFLPPTPLRVSYWIMFFRISRYKDFKEFNSRILVTTDLFGRGMDIERVNIVINYDFPDDNKGSCVPSDSYLHRVGRAGRFGTKGACQFNLIAFSFSIWIGLDEIKYLFVLDVQVWASVLSLLRRMQRIWRKFNLVSKWTSLNCLIRSTSTLTVSYADNIFAKFSF